MKKITKSDLLKVKRPVRYIGSEYNSCIKDKNAKVRVCMAYSNLYEIGAKKSKLNLVYSALNNQGDIWCERAFFPYEDMLNIMETENIGLGTLESGDFLENFDIINFSIDNVLEYSNVLKMLKLSNIDLYHKNRIKDKSPFIIATGDAIDFNCKPISEFVDIFILGDYEKVLLNIVSKYREFKDEGLPKIEFLRALKNVQGVYIPHIHDSNSLIYSAKTDDMTDLYDAEKFVIPNMYESYYNDEKTVVDLTDLLEKNSKSDIVEKLFDNILNETEEDILLKFYVGRPNDTTRELKKISDIVNTIIAVYKKLGKENGSRKITIYFDSYIIYPHTSMQWYKKSKVVDIVKVQNLLAKNITEVSTDIVIEFRDARILALSQILLFADERIFTYIEELANKGFLFYSLDDYKNADVIETKDLDKFKEFLGKKDLSYKFSFDNFVFPAKEKLKLKNEYKKLVSEEDRGE